MGLCRVIEIEIHSSALFFVLIQQKQRPTSSFIRLKGTHQKKEGKQFKKLVTKLTATERYNVPAQFS